MEPLLSLLFPLYRSERFISNIIYNIDQLKDDRYEFIISNRHGEDGALIRLKEKYGHDRRFQFILKDDKAQWTVHYNDLLKKAKGKYFCWVPHDDEYTEDYFKVLVSMLESNSDSILSFGRMIAKGSKWQPDYSVFHAKPAYQFPSMYYIRLLNSEMLGVPFRGIYRREHIIKSNLLLDEGHVQSFQDQYYIFEVLLSGDFIYTDETSCIKNYEKSSAHSNWSRIPMMKRKGNDRKKVLSSVLNSRLSLLRKLGLITFLMAIRVRNKTAGP